MSTENGKQAVGFVDQAYVTYFFIVQTFDRKSQSGAFKHILGWFCCDELQNYHLI